MGIGGTSLLPEGESFAEVVSASKSDREQLHKSGHVTETFRRARIGDLQDLRHLHCNHGVCEGKRGMVSREKVEYHRESIDYSNFR